MHLHTLGSAERCWSVCSSSARVKVSHPSFHSFITTCKGKHTSLLFLLPLLLQMEEGEKKGGDMQHKPKWNPSISTRLAFFLPCSPSCLRIYHLSSFHSAYIWLHSSPFSGSRLQLYVNTSVYREMWCNRAEPDLSDMKDFFFSEYLKVPALICCFMFKISNINVNYVFICMSYTSCGVRGKQLNHVLE